MNNRNSAQRRLHFGCVASGALFGSLLVMACNPAIAQQSTGQPPTFEQVQQPENVEVVTPRAVTQTIGRSTIGAPIEITSITRAVGTADIDPLTPWGAAELEMRVSDTARDLCRQLDSLDPFSQRDRNCVRKAEKAAIWQVDRSIGTESP